MNRLLLIAASLASSAGACFAQATGTSDAASAPKHKWIKKLKNHKPATPASNPEASPDKKGGA